jgi:hypothetical protein
LSSELPDTGFYLEPNKSKLHTKTDSHINPRRKIKIRTEKTKKLAIKTKEKERN